MPLDLPGMESEQLAALPLGGGRFLISSIPLLSRELALGDIVEARRVDEILEFRALLVPGGNRTLRLLVETPFIDQLLARLEQLGCRVEHPLPGVLAVNIAPDTPQEGLSAHLEDLAEQGLLQFAPGDQR